MRVANVALVKYISMHINYYTRYNKNNNICIVYMYIFVIRAKHFNYPTVANFPMYYIYKYTIFV